MVESDGRSHLYKGSGTLRSLGGEYTHEQRQREAADTNVWKEIDQNREDR